MKLKLDSTNCPTNLASWSDHHVRIMSTCPRRAIRLIRARMWKELGKSIKTGQLAEFVMHNVDEMVQHRRNLISLQDPNR